MIAVDSPAALRGALDAAYAASLASALSLAGARALPDGLRPRLPPAIRETILACAALEGGQVPEPLARLYLEASPRMLVEQVAGPRDGPRALLDRPLLAGAPSLVAALEAAERLLAAEGLEAARLWGAPDARALLAQAPTALALGSSSLLACGLPLLGAYPPEREANARALAGRGPDAVLDERLSGRLAHERLHGPLRDTERLPPPWLVQEAAAIHLGAEAFPRHVFPAVAGEAVPGVSLFVLAGQGLARVLGRRALWSALVDPDGWTAAAGERAACALQTAGLQRWLAGRTPPFAPDALDAVEQVKLADCACAPGPPDARAAPLRDLADRALALGPLQAARQVPSLTAAAAPVPWEALPWAAEEPGPLDEAMVRTGLAALFQENALDGCFLTRPSEPPGGRLRLDALACRMEARPRPGGAFGEPARWILPPPVARRLRERGLSAVEVERATRASAGPLAEAVLALSRGGAGLPHTLTLDAAGLPEGSWTSSPK